MTIVVVARYRAAEGSGDLVAAALKDYTPMTLAEPGCATFVALRSRDEPRVFLLYEEYDDVAALDAHRASDHFSAVARDRIWPMLESRDVTLCDVLGS
jgi:quinol monooxygenase YgiN